MTVWRVTSNADYGRAHKAARWGDTLDIDTMLRGEIKVTKPGLLLDFSDGGVDAEGAPHALLVFADYTRVRGGEFTGANGTGIAARGANHLALNGPESHHNARHGVGYMLGEYFDFRNLDVHHNATKGAASGVSVYHPLAEDDRPGYHGRVLNSHIYNNGDMSRKQTDSFGATIDDANGTQPQGGKGNTDDQPHYGQRILIQGNRIHDNGGPGAGAIWSDNVDMIDNDLWNNARQSIFGRNDVEIEFRQAEGGRAIGNDLHGGDMLISGTKASPAEVSGHGNICGLMLRGVVVGVPDHEPGVDAADLGWLL